MKKFSIFVLLVSILLTGSTTYANSGPTFWEGYPSSEILVIDEDSPISVEKEELLFDFTNEEVKDLGGYNLASLVTASYTMNNTSKKHQRVQMAFPLISRIRDFDPKHIQIEVDGESIPYQVFIGDLVNQGPNKDGDSKKWDFSAIVNSISSSPYIPKNYKLDDMGRLYTYDISPPGDEEIFIRISYSYDKNKTKVICKGFNGYHFSEDNGTINESLTTWVRENESFEVFVLGQDIDLKITAYNDVEKVEETNAYSLDIKTEELAIGDYLSKEIEVYSNDITYMDYIADNQISNQIIKLIDRLMEDRVINLELSEIFSLDESDRFFVLIYDVEFDPQAIREVGVSYISRGTMDRVKTSNPTHTFDYILNPAANWASFKDLNIEVRVPSDYPYIIDSSLDFARKEDGTYQASFASLPEEDLYFTLYHKESLSLLDKIKGTLRNGQDAFKGIIPFGVGLLVGFLVRRNYKKKKSGKTK